jgi:hypothetical protein
MLRVGDTLVPLILRSDRTQLTNFAGEKKVWPVYVTFGNVSLKLCQMPTTHSVVMVALLPIPIKYCNFPQMWLDEQQQTNRVLLYNVLQCILEPLRFE